MHQLTKPARKAPEDDDLPSINSHSEDEDDSDSDIESGSEEGAPVSSGIEDDDDNDTSVSGPSRIRSRVKSQEDAEMDYEAMPRKRRPSWTESEGETAIARLPIKLGDGRIQKSNNKVVLRHESSEESEEEDAIPESAAPVPRVEDGATGARFGRAAVVDIIAHKSRKARIQGAKEQIASICQDIVSDPENSVRVISPPPLLSRVSERSYTVRAAASFTYVLASRDIHANPP